MSDSPIVWRAKKSSPCPVCDGDHACSHTEDGLYFCRRRTASLPDWKHLGEAAHGFHLFRHTGLRRPWTPPAPPASSESLASANADNAVPPPTAKPERRKGAADKKPPAHWRRLCGVMQEVRQRFAAGYAGAVASLAEHLGVTVPSLEAVGFGMLPRLEDDNPHGPCWASPEKDAAGAPVGLLCRCQDGKKRRSKGSTNGLSYSSDWSPPTSGLLPIVEGPTDVAAMLSVGIPAIGRPTNTPGKKKKAPWLDWLAQMLRDLPADVDLVVVGENDQKGDGQWPGREGCELTAEGLAERLGRPVRWCMPPPEVKDVRAWLIALRTAAENPGEVIGSYLARDSSPADRVCNTSHVKLSQLVCSKKKIEQTNWDNITRQVSEEGEPDSEGHTPPPTDPTPLLRLRTGLLYCRRNRPDHFRLKRERFTARMACRCNSCGQCLSAKARGAARRAAWKAAEAAAAGHLIAAAEISADKKSWEANKKARARAGSTGCAFCRTSSDAVFLLTSLPPSCDLPSGYGVMSLSGGLSELGRHVNALRPRLPPAGKKRGPQLMGLRGSWRVIVEKGEENGKDKGEGKGKGASDDNKPVRLGRLSTWDSGPVETLLRAAGIRYLKTGTGSPDDGLQWPIWRLSWELPADWTDAQAARLDSEILMATGAGDGGGNPFVGRAINRDWLSEIDDWDAVLFADGDPAEGK